MGDITEVQVSSEQQSDAEDEAFTAVDLIPFITSDDSITDEAFEELVKRVHGFVDGYDKNHQRPLHHAAQMNKYSFVKILLKYGADPSLQDLGGITALHYATKNNNIDMVRSLLERGAIVNVDNNIGFPPLHFAVRDGYLECMRALLEHGANPNKRYVMFNTSFHEIHCVQNDSAESLELLLKFGANTEARDAKGLTALHHACQGGLYQFVKVLLEYGANVNSETPPLPGYRGRFTVLRYAVMSGDSEICRLLLGYGADPDICDMKNVAPIHVATQQGYTDIVQYLLEYGADVMLKNNTGKQPLHRACISGGDTRMLLLLLQYGADPNIVTDVGEVPIHGLMWKYCRTPTDEADTNDAELKEKLLILLNHGAHFNLRNDRSDPYSITNNLRNLEKLPQSLRLILEAADSVDIYGNAGTTPAMIDNELKRKLIEMTTNPQSLKHQTRKCIRGLLGQNICDKIDALPLPQSLNNYILFQ
ncbi:putative ankyrin repeat protein RF_0381 isoform X1 [Ptychodera flava]|uniref:putative ankyrin repeat protein RF_0381 isoform X1 n=1 Tax=Ptychodera flava TaxID=63121 RepID=UPI00396A3D92